MLSPAPATPPLALPNSLRGSSRSWLAHRTGHRLTHSPLCVCVEGRADLQDKLVPTGKREVSKSEGAPSLLENSTWHHERGPARRGEPTAAHEPHVRVQRPSSSLSLFLGPSPSWGPPTAGEAMTTETLRGWEGAWSRREEPQHVLGRRQGALPWGLPSPAPSLGPRIPVHRKPEGGCAAPSQQGRCSQKDTKW